MHEMTIKETSKGVYLVGCKCGWKGLEGDYATGRSGALDHIRAASQLRGRLDKFPG